jgi:hypothetical protein
MMPALPGTYHRGENGQQQPGADIIDGRAGDGHASQAGSQQIAFLQNSGEYRECGNAHGRSHKQCEGGKCTLLTRELRIERFGQADAQNQRQHNADVADQDDRGPLLENAFQVYLEPDHKHEKQQPELAQDRERRHGRRGKDEGESVWKESSEKRGAQDNAGGHLADNPRLPNALKNPAEDTRRQQDSSNREDQLFSLQSMSGLKTVRAR